MAFIVLCLPRPASLRALPLGQRETQLVLCKSKELGQMESRLLFSTPGGDILNTVLVTIPRLIAFYEYHLKAYLYNSHVLGSQTQLFVSSGHILMDIRIGPCYRSGDGTTLQNSMESLSWFAGGNSILGGMVTNNQTLVDYGLSIADAAGAAYRSTATGLGGEVLSWTTAYDDSASEACDLDGSIRISDARFRLRPEVLETLYHAYRATKHPEYRDWSWAAFKAIERYCRTETGYSSIIDVDSPEEGGKSDVQESFVFAEVMKHAFLIQLEEKSYKPRVTSHNGLLTNFQDTPFRVQDARKGSKNTWVFNTDAHPFRIVGPPR
ncbi:glycoside hydrolase [Aureobasidium sp. EXF-12344]|nr:glycoside hydrolase [Aureobasidium sp. EXF-12344]